MTRCCFHLVLFSLLVCLGCGGQESNVASQTATEADAGSPATTQVASSQPSPSDVVSQFLDQVRRGGENVAAGDLLTARAQSELKRIGREVQPIGSPDAHFEVTRSEAVPNESDSRLVHTLWREPGSDGTPVETQVVWALELEEAGWRISGLAMQLEPGQPPTIIDFENGDLMAKLLAEPAEPSQTAGDNAQATTGDEASQAAAAGDQVTR